MPVPVGTAGALGEACSSSGAASSGRWVVARPVVQFVLIGIAAVVIVGLATAMASRRVGEREAITDARTTTLVKAQGLIEPIVTPGLVTGDPAAIAAVDDAVAKSVIDGSLVRVKIWTARRPHRLLDEPRLDRHHVPRSARTRSPRSTAGRIEAEVSDLAKPENRYERQYGKLLEVYLPIRTPSGEPPAVRGLLPLRRRCQPRPARIWRSFAPMSLGALVVLELVQIPLAWSLARRLRAAPAGARGAVAPGARSVRGRAPPDRQPTSTTASCRTSPAWRTRWPAPPAQPERPPDAGAVLERAADGVRSQRHGAALDCWSRSTRRTSPRRASASALDRPRRPTPSRAVSRRRSTRRRCGRRCPAPVAACSTDAPRRAAQRAQPRRRHARRGHASATTTSTRLARGRPTTACGFDPATPSRPGRRRPLRSARTRRPGARRRAARSKFVTAPGPGHDLHVEVPLR